jgi:hypothetical protein
MGSPSGDRRRDQLATRERQAGPHGVAGIRGQNLKPLCSGVDYRNEMSSPQFRSVASAKPRTPFNTSSSSSREPNAGRSFRK